MELRLPTSALQYRPLTRIMTFGCRNLGRRRVSEVLEAEEGVEGVEIKRGGGSRPQAGGSRKVVDINSSEDEFVPASADAAPAREIKLRARPKPKPKTSVNSPTKERAPQESSSASGSEFEDT